MKKYLLLFILLCMAFAFTACGEEEKAPKPSLQLSVCMPENLVELTEMEVKKFIEAQKENWDLTIHVEPKTTGEVYQLMREDPSSLPDVFCLDSYLLPEFYQSGVLAKLASGDPTYLDDYFSGLSAACYFGSDVYALPFAQTDGNIVYFDQRLFPDGFTFELEEILQTLEEKGKTIAFHSVDFLDPITTFFYGNNCFSRWSVDPNDTIHIWEDTFASERGLDALRGYRSLVQSPAFSPDDDFFGNAGVVIGSLEHMEEYSACLEDYLGLSNMPIYTTQTGISGMATTIFGYFLGIRETENEDVKKVAQELALYLLKEEAMEERFTKLEYYPVLRSSLQWKSIIRHERSSAFLVSCASGYAASVHPAEWSEQLMLLSDKVKQTSTDKELEQILQDYADALRGLDPTKE